MALMQAAGMLKRWRIAPATVTGATDQAAAHLAATLRLHPLTAHLLACRGLVEPDRARRFVKPSLLDLHDPAALPGCDAAAQRIGQAVADDQPIIIYGDYDVDGITASAILWHTLTQLGAKVSTYVPHRIDEGYGLNTEAIRKLATSGPRRPLIISVDCGITAFEPARAAKEAGADLIITDHHELSPQGLPDACALVHPRLPGSAYPFGELCGAGVAFKLAWHVARVHCGSERVPEPMRDLLMDLLSFVALGTVADLVPLLDENRVMTVYGLSRVKQTRFIGLNAMIDAASLRDEKIDAYHVGFVLGPRLNACGRMRHASQAVHLLTAAQHNESQQLAEFLTLENDRRRRTERDIYKEAAKMVEHQAMDGPDCRAIVLGSEGWHAGVVGIVASRLVERFSRPVVMLSYDNGNAHGSARSVAGVSIHEAFCACSDHLTSYGGHAMAAGLKLPTQRVTIFRDALIEFVNARLSPDDLVSVIDADAACTLGDLSLELFRQVQQLAPFGRGNPAPKLWLQGARLSESPRRMGKRGDHLSLTFTDGRRYMRGVAFGKGDLAGKLAAGCDVEAVCEPKVSTWQGTPRPELHVEDIRLV